MTDSQQTNAAVRSPLRRKLWLAGGALLLLLCAAAGGWLLWNSDDYEAEAARLQELLEVREGMTVAEIGAGEGEMTLLFSRIAGAEGRVFSTEIDEEKLETIRERVREAGAKNVTVVEGAAAETNLPPGCCDAVFLRAVYHHFKDPQTMAASLFETLREGRRLAVIDFEPRATLPDVEGVPENRGGHGMPLDLLIEEMASAGFRRLQVIDPWVTERYYCVVFERPAAEPEGPQAEGASGDL